MPKGDKGATFAQPSVDEQEASPYLTSVGGTMFDPVYDSAGNDISVIGDNLETAWNEGGSVPRSLSDQGRDRRRQEYALSKTRVAEGFRRTRRRRPGCARYRLGRQRRWGPRVLHRHLPQTSLYTPRDDQAL
jgi:hypothetical protein